MSALKVDRTLSDRVLFGFWPVPLAIAMVVALILLVAFSHSATLTAVVINVGAIAGLWGLLWFSLDYNARAPGWLIGIGLVLLLTGSAFARDMDGRYANSTLKPWFDQLKSGKGLCCSDADGSAISDADWKTTKDGKHYQVRIDDQWLDVPDEAVITEPNRAGRTMVWPIKGYLGTSIRCFMPGIMG